MPGVLRSIRSDRPAQVQRWAALALAGMASLARAGAPAGADSGIVCLADGGPFTVIRGEDLRTGSRGAALLTGDILETGPGAFLVIQTRSGLLLGVGPSSQVYWAVSAGGVSALQVRKGWLKADLRGAGESGRTRIAGPRMGVLPQQSVVLLEVQDSFEAMFDEQGAGTLCCMAPAQHAFSGQIRSGQFLVVRADGMGVTLQPRPAEDFLAQMPVPFRDNLPQVALAALRPVQTGRVRKVSYADIEPWLLAPRSWQTGFVGRFRGRLRDPAFFAAMDAHLDRHPEWAPLLHPPARAAAQGRPAPLPSQ
jgi:hypothetical protein